jgi:hypothetical protein
MDPDGSEMRKVSPPIGKGSSILTKMLATTQSLEESVAKGDTGSTSSATAPAPQVTTGAASSG